MMNRNASPIPVPLIACTAALYLALFASITSLLMEEEGRERMEALFRHSLVMFREGRKRRGGDTEGIACKKIYIKLDRDRARQCIQQDYLGPILRFNEDDFKWMFHVFSANLIPFSKIHMMPLKGSLYQLMPRS
jgi:hypothetical protein